MAREKKAEHKVQMTDGKRNICQRLLWEYDIRSGEKILRILLMDLIGSIMKERMEVEMKEHRGCGKLECSDTDDYHNGYKAKRINSSYGSMDIQVLQDHKSLFEL